jgi:hypothetical protein
VSIRAFVDGLNDKYFESRLSPDVVERLCALPVDRDDARAFVERVCRFMHAGRYPAHDVSPFQAGMLGSLVARLLPGRWEGRVPPITVAGRHRKIDELIARRFPEPSRLIDVACGFPPLTTLDSAAALAGWDIVGVDRSLPAYVVHDGRDNYCVYDSAGEAQYFQPLMPTADAWATLLDDWTGSKTRFEALLHALRNEGSHGSHPHAALTVDPALAYERPGLRFVRSDLATFTSEPAHVVRCFNMLLYFDAAFRRAALQQCAALLREGGLLICGTDWVETMECRYFIYAKRDGVLVPDEFAFSLDNLAALGVVPWYTLHDDDAEVTMTSRLAAALRADVAFESRLRTCVDALRLEKGLGARRADGYYDDPDSSATPETMWVDATALSHRLDTLLASDAARVLTHAGWAARVNEAGHVAVSLGYDGRGREFSLSAT